MNHPANIAGAGINIAQRVMDCGDAEHILVSKRVADDLDEFRRWQPYLHDLGDFEVKHGTVISLVLALEQLVLSAKNAAGISYGELKLQPQWDPLRGDPRFEKLVASLAPKS
ncbi:MAG: hypothetical protein ACR2FX_03505 [Chthoniobacterales bacterium]